MSISTTFLLFKMDATYTLNFVGCHFSTTATLHLHRQTVIVLFFVLIHYFFKVCVFNFGQKQIVHYLLFLWIIAAKKELHKGTQENSGNSYCFADIITNTHGLGFAIYMVI